MPPWHAPASHGLLDGGLLYALVPGDWEVERRVRAAYHEALGLLAAAPAAAAASRDARRGGPANFCYRRHWLAGTAGPSRCRGHTAGGPAGYCCTAGVSPLAGSMRYRRRRMRYSCRSCSLRRRRRVAAARLPSPCRRDPGRPTSCWCHTALTSPWGSGRRGVGASEPVMVSNPLWSEAVSVAGTDDTVEGGN